MLLKIIIFILGLLVGLATIIVLNKYEEMKETQEELIRNNAILSRKLEELTKK